MPTATQVKAMFEATDTARLLEQAKPVKQRTARLFMGRCGGTMLRLTVDGETTLYRMTVWDSRYGRQVILEQANGTEYRVNPRTGYCDCKSREAGGCKHLKALRAGLRSAGATI